MLVHSPYRKLFQHTGIASVSLKAVLLLGHEERHTQAQRSLLPCGERCTGSIAEVVDVMEAREGRIRAAEFEAAFAMLETT